VRGRVFSNLQLKEIAEVVEADHLAVLHFDGRQRAASLARQHGDGSAALREQQIADGARQSQGETDRERVVADAATSQKVYMISVRL
jgi:hypothetical protein